MKNNENQEGELLLTAEEKYWVNHRVFNEIIHRKCSKCDEWLPETTEFFYMINKSKPEMGFMAECKECGRKRAIKYRQDNLEKQRATRMAWHWKNKDHENMINRQWKKDNIERKQKYQSNYQKNNPDKVRKYTKNKAQYGTHKITAKEWRMCKQYFNNECAYCGLPEEDHYRIIKGISRKEDLHKEHVIHNGSNGLENCVPSCQSCNSQKWEFTLEEWYNKSNANFTNQRLNKIIKWMKEDCFLKTV